jgi:hypothetical protein
LKRGEVTTAALRAEFRKETRLQIMLGDDNFLKLVREGVLVGEYIYRSGDLIFGQGDPYAEIKIDDQSFVMTMAHAKEQSLWPRAPKSKRPTPYPPVEAHRPGGGVAEVAGAGGADGEMLTGGAPGGAKPPSTASFQAEAPLKEALTLIWEQARQRKVAKLASLRLRVFEVADAFKLLSAVTSIQGAEKKVSIDAEYETTDGGSLRMEFSGSPQDAGPLKEFLEPQFRAAKEKSLNVTHLLVFADGLQVTGDAPEKLAEKLTRFATGAAFVEASAEASK